MISASGLAYLNAQMWPVQQRYFNTDQVYKIAKITNSFYIDGPLLDHSCTELKSSIHL
jgi:hypothetical protein